jgi:8-oxo-dGTP pyrophosphatase MutT (NUDIX family)
MNNLRNSTLVFLIKQESNKVSEVCLAMKKRGFGMGRWNGVGGKVENGESIEQAGIRETHEEIGVKIEKLKKVGELEFYFSNNPAWDQLVTVFFCYEWTGDPKESEEMNPEWFKVENVPFDHMWPDDRFWLPNVLSGKLVKGSFTFGEGDIIISQNLKSIDSF